MIISKTKLTFIYDIMELEIVVQSIVHEFLKDFAEHWYNRYWAIIILSRSWTFLIDRGYFSYFQFIRKGSWKEGFIYNYGEWNRYSIINAFKQTNSSTIRTNIFTCTQFENNSRNLRDSNRRQKERIMIISF